VADTASRVFIPGFAARVGTYAGGLPLGWDALQPPPPSSSGGSLASLRMWAVAEVLDRPGRTLLAGHSMGAALAVLTAASVPEHVAGLVLVAPAGLPLRKPIARSAASLARQLVSGVHTLEDAFTSARELLRAPRGAARLVRSLRRLDLSAQMEQVRAACIPTTVVGCTSDTLVTPGHCRRAAALLGAEYRELDLPGGHVWMLYRPRVLTELLSFAPTAR
jgi:pimeloyl-ACP methyl ester carboxylesterase